MQKIQQNQYIKKMREIMRNDKCPNTNQQLKQKSNQLKQDLGIEEDLQEQFKQLKQQNIDLQQVFLSQKKSYLEKELDFNWKKISKINLQILLEFQDLMVQNLPAYKCTSYIVNQYIFEKLSEQWDKIMQNDNDKDYQMKDIRLELKSLQSQLELKNLEIIDLQEKVQQQKNIQKILELSKEESKRESQNDIRDEKIKNLEDKLYKNERFQKQLDDQKRKLEDKNRQLINQNQKFQLAIHSFKSQIQELQETNQNYILKYQQLQTKCQQQENTNQINNDQLQYINSKLDLQSQYISQNKDQLQQIKSQKDFILYNSSSSQKYHSPQNNNKVNHSQFTLQNINSIQNFQSPKQSYHSPNNKNNSPLLYKSDDFDYNKSNKFDNDNDYNKSSIYNKSNKFDNDNDYNKSSIYNKSYNKPIDLENTGEKHKQQNNSVQNIQKISHKISESLNAKKLKDLQFEIQQKNQCLKTQQDNSRSRSVKQYNLLSTFDEFKYNSPMAKNDLEKKQEFNKLAEQRLQHQNNNIKYLLQKISLKTNLNSSSKNYKNIINNLTIKF